MSRAAELKLPVAVHAEDDEMTSPPRARSSSPRCHRQSRDYLDSRPIDAETGRSLSDSLARETGCPLHIVHVSSAAGLRLIAEARRQEWMLQPRPARITALDENDVFAIGAAAKCAPPLRSGPEQRISLAGPAGGPGQHHRLRSFPITTRPEDQCEFLRGLGWHRGRATQLSPLLRRSPSPGNFPVIHRAPYRPQRCRALSPPQQRRPPRRLGRRRRRHQPQFSSHRPNLRATCLPVILFRPTLAAQPASTSPPRSHEGQVIHGPEPTMPRHSARILRPQPL